MGSALITNVYAPGAFVDADVLTRAVQRKAAFLVATNVCDAAQLTEQGLGGRV